MSDSLIEPTPSPAPPSAELGGAGPAAAAGRLLLTADLRAATGLSRTHMDFYLREGLVRPTARSESGLLLFDEAELTTLRDLLRWRQDGIGLKQIRQRLGR